MSKCIRRAIIGDVDAILALEKEVWGETFLRPYALGALIQFGYVFVAEDADRLIGFLSAMRTTNRNLFVLDLAVLKDYRASGVSNMLCDELAAFDGCIISAVESANVAALALHAKYGFVEMPDTPVVEGSTNMIQIKRMERPK